MSLFRQERARPFGLPRTPFDPRSGGHLPFDQGGVAVVTVVAEGYDALLCEDRDRRPILVAKPWPLRKSSFHEVTLEALSLPGNDPEGERKLTSLVPNARNVAWTSDPDETWRVERHAPYLAGEKIVAFKHHEHDRVVAVVAEGELEDVDSGEHLVQWEDANTAGRRWESGDERFVLETEYDQDLYCVAPDGRHVWVAKPPRLFLDTWDGKTISGVTYTSVSEGRRSATDGSDTEDQRITPSYVAGETIRARRVSLFSADWLYWWEDVAAGREWATLPDVEE